MEFVILASILNPISITLSQLMAMVEAVNQYQLQELNMAPDDTGPSSSTSNNESQVPSFNPKQINKNSPQTHQYATCSKDRPLMLMTTTDVGSGGLRKTHSVNFFGPVANHLGSKFTRF